MRRVLLTLLVAVWAAVTHGVVRADAAGDFSRANTLYEQGDYAGAIAVYGQLVDSGIDNADLYYNLGNAHYKTGDLGRAVLFYERSLRLRPRDREARDNLQLIRTQLQDKQFVTNQNRFIRALIWLHNNLSTRESVVFVSLSWLLFCGMAVLIVLRDTRVVRRVYERVSVASPGRLLGFRMTQDLVAGALIALMLLGTSATSALSKIDNERDRRRAVVLADEVPVFSSPTQDATLQFKIHEGTLVDVDERRQEWVRIVLPGSLSGWVEAQSVESI